MASIKTLYTASATAHGGRTGKVTSEDGRVDLDLSVPKELGGTGGDGTNPEQLFAAGYAACFQSALGLVGGREKVDTSASTVAAQVGIGPNGSGGYGLAVTLTIAIPGVERAVAEALVEKAHAVCPYSNAVHGNVDVTLAVADSGN